MRKWSLLGIIFSIILVLAACGSKEEASSKEHSGGGNKTEETKEVTIKHQYGEAVIKKNPKNIVVFDFGILDTFDELGIEPTGVPQAIIPGYLKKYGDKKYTNVGSLKEPDFEAIHALKPDVIFISARQAELYDQFAEIAPTVYVGLDYANYMSSFEKNMKLVGEIFGKEDEVAAELKDIDTSVEKLNKKASGLDQKGLILLSAEGKMSAYGPSSRFGVIHDVFGVKAADDKIEVSTHGQSVSFEYIMEKDPEVLFVIDRNVAIGGEAGAKKTMENELVKKTAAYKNDKIVYLDPEAWYLSGGGLKSVKAMVKEIEEAL
ncbi:siderophore ABC transporter substrate-binding protein [Bacillus sp. JJ1764]|uniref:siderophore ABC transporter substrate-binding protein n=1 Tax=Bacillus sp. JJ1764 TaxID=3122964 RepID=UPI002FFFE9D8